MPRCRKPKEPSSPSLQRDLARASWGLACLLLWSPAWGASWQEIDARTLAWGGIAVLDRLDRSPGTDLPTGITLQAGGVWHFLGSGLVAHGLRLRRVGERLAWGLSTDWLRSDIHREQDSIAALQLGVRRGRLGIALGYRELRFSGYAAWRRPIVRFGVGARPQERIRVVFVVERPEVSQEGPRCTVGVGAHLEARLDVALQLEREPTLPVRLRVGLCWLAMGRIGTLCGYDAVTSSFTAGIMLHGRSCGLTYGTASHPDLGWSHGWMLEWQR